jgi:D-alanyl-D-alanine dipeptidase
MARASPSTSHAIEFRWNSSLVQLPGTRAQGLRAHGRWRFGLTARGLARLFAVVLGAIAAHAASRAEMPRGFVYLRDVAPDIAQDIRYAGPENFVGRKVKGYEAAECVLTKQAAEAVKRAHEKLHAKGFGLKVLDCYRPVRAVEDFVDWADDGSQRTKAYYYPTLRKGSLFSLNFISSRSRHSAGSTVDLTLVPFPAASPSSAEGKPTVPTPDGPCFKTSVYLQGPLDMGSDFDCFHPKSHFHSEDISAAARTNRDTLRAAMREEGFFPMATEWWHYTLRDEPFEGRRFDFPIVPRPSPGNDAK